MICGCLQYILLVHTLHISLLLLWIGNALPLCSAVHQGSGAGCLCQSRWPLPDTFPSLSGVVGTPLDVTQTHQQCPVRCPAQKPHPVHLGPRQSSLHHLWMELICECTRECAVQCHAMWYVPHHRQDSSHLEAGPGWGSSQSCAGTVYLP